MNEILQSVNANPKALTLLAAHLLIVVVVIIQHRAMGTVVDRFMSQGRALELLAPPRAKGPQATEVESRREMLIMDVEFTCALVSGRSVLLTTAALAAARMDLAGVLLTCVALIALAWAIHFPETTRSEQYLGEEDATTHKRRLFSTALLYTAVVVVLNVGSAVVAVVDAVDIK